MKKICSICNKNVATWFYAPSSDDDPFYCDDCVPRGCSCNVYSLEEFPNDIPNKNVIFWDKDIVNSTLQRTPDSVFYEIVDNNGRRYPCCEYWYDENGWDFEDNTNNEEEK